MKIYVIGSLRNPEIPKIGKAIREVGHDAFDDWFAAGPHADDCWRDYERQRGHTYIEALDGHAARHVFGFDKYHLDTSDAGVLVLPAGKSGHLELGYLSGQGKPTYILLDGADNAEEFRYDVMYCFATKVFGKLDDLLWGLAETEFIELPSPMGGPARMLAKGLR